MDASKFPGVNLLIKYIYEDITEEELALLYKYMEDSPVLKEKFEEWSDPVKLRDRFRYQFDIDSEANWQKIKSAHFTDQKPATGFRIKLNWRRFLFRAAVILFILCAAGAVIYFNVFSKKAVLVKVQPHHNHVANTPITEDSIRGYTSPEDKGGFNLADMSQHRIDLSGISIFNLGSLFSIEHNNREMEKARTIKLVTAEKQKKIQLPDSSQVTLNQNSSIKFSFPFERGQRTVELLGEAYFDVKSNPKVPFVVQLSNNAQVKAFGTRFNVNFSGKNCYATLLHGQVTVTKGRQTKTILEGQQLQITEGHQPFKVTRADPVKVIAWTRKNGFDYRNIGFRQMMDEIGRWYGYEVSFRGKLPQGTCDIKLNEDADLDFLLETIEKDDNVDIEKTPNKKLIVTGK